MNIPHTPVPQEPMPVVLDVPGAPLLTPLSVRAAQCVIFVLLPVCIIAYLARPL